MTTDLDTALLVLNDWLGEPVRLLVLARDGAPPDAPPPSGPEPGWHVVLGHEARLGRPDVMTDSERQLNVGTYVLGGSLPKLLLDGLPCERIRDLGDKLAFYLSESVVLVLERLSKNPPISE